MADALAEIHVVGLQGRRPGSAEGESALRAARVVAAGVTTLAGLADELAALDPPPELVELGSGLAATVDDLVARPGPVVVLASGDPGFFGIVRSLAARVGAERLVVHPAPSSIARAWAAIGVPSDDARVVSVHGRAPHRALGALLAGPKVAVLTAPDAGPAELAAAYAAIPAAPPRRLAVAERLGSSQERVTAGSPEEIADGTFAAPNVLLGWAPDRAVAAAPGALHPPRLATDWGLPETAFAHRDGMITKREVRAAALAALGPGPGDVVWDVGSGSGSVAVECARLGAGVVALDHDPDAVRLTRENATAHGVELAAVEGRAPGALAALPDPDVVFVGGGGGDVDRVLEAAARRARRAVVVTLAAVERIGPVLAALQDAGLDADGTLLQASRIRPLAGAHRLDATNPVAVLVGRRPVPAGA